MTNKSICVLILNFLASLAGTEAVDLGFRSHFSLYLYLNGR